MSIPYSTERVLDMVLRSLRASGLIADDVSAESIRGVSNNMTDAELDALAATLNYGGTSGTSGDAIFAIEDFDLVIDSDDSQSGIGPYFQQFRVERGDTTLPITDPDDHLMSVGYFNFDTFNNYKGALLTVGPTQVVAPGADRRAAVDIAFNDTFTRSQARLYGGPDATLPNDPGFRIIGRSKVEISGSPEIQFSGTNSLDMGTPRFMKGGFVDNHTANARFCLGDNATDDCLYFERLEDSGGNFHFQIRTKNDSLLHSGPTTAPKLFIGGSNATTFWPKFVSIGGQLDGTYDPWNRGYPTFSVISNVGGTFPVCKFLYQDAYYSNGMAGAWPGDAIFHFHTNSDNATPAHYIFRVTRNPEMATTRGIFNIDSNEDINIGVGKAYNSAGADAAEWLDTVDGGEKFKIGTVLIINHEGKLEPSHQMADMRVIGVVSNTAGLKLGSPGDAVELDGVKPKGKALVAAIGKVSVRCRADNGSIHPGDRLTSGPDGCAVRAESSTNGAAILGKSLGTLTEGEGKVEALVSW